MRILLRSFHTYPFRYLVVCVLGAYFLTLYPFNFLQRNKVAALTNGLSFVMPATAYTLHPHEALSYLYQFTFLLHVTPATDDVGRAAHIMCSGNDEWSQNFSINQWHNHLNVQFFNRESKQFNELTIPEIFKKNKPSWIALTFNGTTIRCYVDGVKKAERKTGPMALTQWDSASAIVFGTDASGRQQWEGAIHSAAIFDRAFKAAELKKPDLIFTKYSSIIHYEFGGRASGYLRSTGRDRDSVCIPELFTPYCRSTLLDTFRVLGRQRLDVRDIVANIFFFLPMGYFFALALRRRCHSVLSFIMLSIGFGLMLSVSMESLQILLPSRFSSMVDVLSNTTGTAIGAALSTFIRTDANDTSNIAAPL